MLLAQEEFDKKSDEVVIYVSVVTLGNLMSIPGTGLSTYS